MSKICRQCGQVIHDGDKICVRCGARQEMNAGSQEAHRESSPKISQPVLTRSMNRNQQPYQHNQYQQAPSPQPAYPKPAYVPSAPPVQQPAPKKKGKKGLLITLVCLILVGAIAGAVWMYTLGPMGCSLDQSSPERLMETACQVLSRSYNNQKLFGERELKAVYDYRFGEESARYVVKAGYNYIGAYLTNPQYYGAIQMQFGSNITLSCHPTLDTPIARDDYGNYLGQGVLPYDKIAEMHLYDVELTISGTQTQTQKINVPLIKATDGKWYFIVGSSKVFNFN